VTPARRDAAWALAALMLLAGWEASSADLAVAGLLAGPQGFGWRDLPLLTGLHEAGRWLAWVLLALLAADTLRPRVPGGPDRAARAFGLAVVLSTAVAVPGLKRLSRTSCPWDLASYGGSVPYVPHWLPTLADGGPGHCFPSGHAVAVLAFIGVYFVWRGHRPGLARAIATAVGVLGAVYGTVQVLRGAHFVSHVLWSAWLCWAIAATAEAARQGWLSRRTDRRPQAAPAAPGPGASTPPPWPRGRAGCAGDSPAG
jgi:membrane-associated PAP2 superfamily phosphatase